MEPYCYSVQLRDTDAAGVIYFANLLAICHGAYETALATAGIDLKAMVTNPLVALPIIHTSADYKRPIGCGDHLQIFLHPTRQSPSQFSVTYRVCLADGTVAGLALTQHVAIHVSQRQRVSLPPEIDAWIDASNAISPEV